MATKYILFLDKEGRINFGMEGSDKFAKLIKDPKWGWSIDEKQFDKSEYNTLGKFFINFNVFLRVEKNLNLGLAVVCPSPIAIETLEDVEQISLNAKKTFCNAVIEIINCHKTNFQDEVYESIELSTIRLHDYPLTLPFSIDTLLRKMGETGIVMRKLILKGFDFDFLPDNLTKLDTLEIEGGVIDFARLASSLAKSSIRRFTYYNTHRSKTMEHRGSPFQIIAANNSIEEFVFDGRNSDESFPDDFIYDEKNLSPSLLRIDLFETTLILKPLEKNILVSLLSQDSLLHLFLGDCGLSKSQSLLILLNKTLKANKTLVSLTLRLNELNDKHLKVLSEGLQTAPNLQTLDLSFNDLGVASVNILNNLLEKDKLTALSLACNNYLDDDFLSLLSAQLKPCRNLTELDLGMSGENFKWYIDKGLLAVFTALQQPKINLRKLKYAYLCENEEKGMPAELKETYMIATLHALEKNKLTEFDSGEFDLYDPTIAAYKVRNKHNQNRSEYYIGAFAILVAFVKANLNHSFQHSILPLLNVILNLLEENNEATLGTLINEKTTAEVNLSNDEKHADAKKCLENLMPLRSTSLKFFDKLIGSKTFLNFVNDQKNDSSVAVSSANTKKRKK